jgi:hypothetical protein
MRVIRGKSGSPRRFAGLITATTGVIDGTAVGGFAAWRRADFSALVQRTGSVLKKERNRMPVSRFVSAGNVIYAALARRREMRERRQIGI